MGDKIKKEDIAKIVEQAIKQQTKVILESFKEFQKEIKAEVSEFRKNLEFLNNKYDEILTQNKNLENKVNNIETDLKNIKETSQHVKNLKNKLTKMEYENKIQNIEIVGIPKNENEKLEAITKILAEKLEIKEHQNDIETIYRTNKKESDGNIIIKLRSREIRNKWLEAQKKNKIYKNDIDATQDKKRIFINEHLPNETKMLLKEVKTIKNELGIKFVWTKNGRKHYNKRKGRNES